MYFEDLDLAKLVEESDSFSEIVKNTFVNQNELIRSLSDKYTYDFRIDDNIRKKASRYIDIIKNDKSFRVEKFLQKYSLSTEEGIAVMSLAEALLRVPDNSTAKDLLIDKLSKKDWKKYIEISRSFLLTFSSVGLYTAGRVLSIDKVNSAFSKITRNIADPIVLSSVKAAIKFLSSEFIIGADLDKGFKNAKNNKKFLYSFDLLGESSRNSEQAENYYNQYMDAIKKLRDYFPEIEDSLYDRPNLSVKLTALYPRIESLKFKFIKSIFIDKLFDLVEEIRDNKLTISFDAEESFRQEIYLSTITSIIKNPEFSDFNGIGFVVQSYSKRAIFIIRYIISLAKKYKKIIPIRLVKGAYWDSEIKMAQEKGLEDYPLFTKKDYTDANYLACASEMLSEPDYIYPQFATHNAYTIATISEIAKGKRFEFQKLYGMGNSLYSKISNDFKVREYAPIGQLSDLLAYLMRRLLENGANNSFVNKVNSSDVSKDELLKPVSEKVKEILENSKNLIENQGILRRPEFLFPKRKNSKGIDLGYLMHIENVKQSLEIFQNKIYKIGPIIDGVETISKKHQKEVFRPGNFAEKIGEVTKSSISQIKEALDVSKVSYNSWSKLDVKERSKILEKIADIYEDNQYELCSILIKEAGKSTDDSINEIREAIDFCRYYAIQAEELINEQKLPGPTGEENILSWHARGVFLCISPWNFPLAIFTGQVVAALVSGNAVIAKPAEQTSIIANYAIKLMHQAGVPKSVLHLIIASGSTVDEYLVRNNEVKGIAFTGSTETAKIINLSIASRDGAIIPLIAETGGQNAMIVDSTALLEQVTDDVIKSSFYSAGQRCSALRVLYVQEEIYNDLIEMISGAIQQLKIGDTIDLSNDIGPVIDSLSKTNLENHISNMTEKGFNVVSSYHIVEPAKTGYFFYPHVIEVSSINDIDSEKFGPILHIIKYKYSDFDQIIDEINNYGFGLTFGIHTRIEDKVEYVRSRINVGNMYVNRAMTGAVVQSQPFGGENKSGTGFKAGGPNYLKRFMTERAISKNLTAIGGNVELLKLHD